MAELWIIPSWVYSRQHMHVSMRSHYKAKGIWRNNMLFAWLQKLQQPLPALPADGSSVHCLHFSTCEERQKPSSRGQILTGKDVSSERTSFWPHNIHLFPCTREVANCSWNCSHQNNHRPISPLRTCVLQALTRHSGWDFQYLKQKTKGWQL